MMRQELIHFGILEQRLGGNAAPVETRPTSPVHLHTRYFFAQLPRANCSHISGWSAANDNQIIIGHNIILVCRQIDQNSLARANESCGAWPWETAPAGPTSRSTDFHEIRRPSRFALRGYLSLSRAKTERRTPNR